MVKISTPEQSAGSPGSLRIGCELTQSSLVSSSTDLSDQVETVSINDLSQNYSGYILDTTNNLCLTETNRPDQKSPAAISDAGKVWSAPHFTDLDTTGNTN
jgi:hypothetical protein